MSDRSDPRIDRAIVTYIKQIADPLLLSHSLGISLDRNNRAPCPVHGGDNKTAFSLDVPNGRWSCFSHGCHQGHSDLIGLVMLMRKCDFKTAVMFIAEVCGIDLSSDLSKEAETAMIRKDTADFIHRSSRWIPDESVSESIEEEIYHLKQYRTDYFLQRGYTTKTLDYFEVGFGHDKYGVPREMFPIREEYGRVVAIDGRRVDNDDEPRYFIQTEGFQKGNLLYHYYAAKNYIQLFNGVIFVVEGYKACWSMIQSGFYNTVACMGSGLSKEQPRLLLSDLNIKTVVLVLDADVAGRNGTVRNQRELGHLFDLRSVELPDGEDPSTLSPDILKTHLKHFLKDTR